MPSKTRMRAGWLVSAAVVLFLLADGGVALVRPSMLAGNMAETGFPADMVRPLGVIIVACALIYAFGRTAVLGAILVTAFAGGGIAMHFRLGTIAAPPQLICAALAALAWAGLWLRDDRLRALLPLG